MFKAEINTYILYIRFLTQCAAVVYAALVGTTAFMYWRKWRIASKGAKSEPHGRKSFGRRRVDVIHWLGLLPRHVAFEGMLGVSVAVQQFLIATKRIDRPLLWYYSPLGLIILLFGIIGLVAVIRHEYRLINPG